LAQRSKLNEFLKEETMPAAPTAAKFSIDDEPQIQLEEEKP